MSYGLFEHLAAEGLEERDAQRKAIIVAKKRADDRFGNFFRQASTKDEFDARLSMVNDDFADVITAACNEYGVDSASVVETVIASFIPEQHIAKVAATQHEARKPKMCPYHKEVTDISLAAGEAQAGFNAMSGHAWSDKHCQGKEYDGGKCNFKPEMTTQSYWDEKAEQAQQRREQREEQAQQQEFTEPVEETPEFEAEPVEVNVEETDLPDNVIEVDFGGNDQASSDQEVPMAVAASFQVEADALKTVDVDAGSDTPSPKMDKRKWTPENVRKLDDVDAENGPHPTKSKDPIEPIVAENDSELTEIGEGVTERQDVTKDTNPSDQGKGGTFPKGNGADPVTSKWAPQEILESVS